MSQIAVLLVLLALASCSKVAQGEHSSAAAMLSLTVLDELPTLTSAYCASTTYKIKNITPLIYHNHYSKTP